MDTAIVGMGLIGGSFYKAINAAGYDAVGNHYGDDTGWEPAELILLCVPPEAVVPWIRRHSSTFRRGAVVMDVSGVKRSIMEEVRPLQPKEYNFSPIDKERRGWLFIGGHPMAGREVSGYENSREDLFVGASMILTPPKGTPRNVMEKLKAFFAAIGFHETVVTTPEKHDDMIAFTSQLCHVIATTYSCDPRVQKSIGFTAGSYANMTRIATQDSDVWSSLYLANRDRLVDVLDGFAQRFQKLRDAIASGDRHAVKRIIDAGTKAKRQELLDRQRGDERV